MKHVLKILAFGDLKNFLFRFMLTPRIRDIN